MMIETRQIAATARIESEWLERVCGRERLSVPRPYQVVASLAGWHFLDSLEE